MTRASSSATASAIFFGEPKSFACRFGFENHVRMNGVSSRIAIALLPHQIFHDCSNDWLKPK